MTVAALISYLADRGAIPGRPDQRVLRDALSELGLYPETEVHEITHEIFDPREEGSDA